MERADAFFTAHVRAVAPSSPAFAEAAAQLAIHLAVADAALHLVPDCINDIAGIALRMKAACAPLLVVRGGEGALSGRGVSGRRSRS